MTGILNILAGALGVAKDTYFNLVSLLLPGNGTNGAQNNTFLDSSTNNFTITRNGDTTQGTFSPFSQTGWSNRFDGSANYRLTIPDSTDLDLTGDFCLEMWVYVTANSSSGQLVCIGNENAGQNGFIFYLPGGTTTVSLYTNGGAPLTTSSGAIALNTWHHLALVRSGAGAGNTVIYVDGVSKGSAQITTSFTGIAANGLCIGQTYNGSFVGVSNTYISNVRLVKGSPVYTGAFTPPTSPLTAITNTVLLTCQSNRFVDTNTQTTAKTITVTGSPSVTPFSPFAPTSSYSSAAVGGSGYFDGSGDYLTIADTTELELGSSNFTIEAWIYPTATPGASGATIIGKNSATYPGGYEFNLVLDNARTLSFNVYTTTLVSLQGTTVLPLNAWTHVAASRSGNDYAIYVNGSREDLDSAGGTIQATSSSIYIGEYGGGGRVITGYISSLRVVKGSYVYNPSSTSVTIPTAPLTAITDTKLLLNFTNAGVVDATAKNVLETEGNAQISTTQSKWGGGSIKFDGTGDAARIPDDEKENLRFGTGNFTIEFWAWKSANGSMDYDTVISIGSTGSYNGGFSVELSASRGFCFISDNAIRVQSNFNPNDSTWNHYAVVRDGSTFALYKNGSRLTTATLSTTLGITGTAYVGAGALTDNSFNGYIDDLRVTKGLARYTGTTYTTPTAPFPVQ